MSNEENQDPCAVSTNPNENNNQELVQNVGLATSIAPTLSVEDVTIEGSTPENTSVIVNMSFVEGISSPEALRWYDDADYSQFLRIRVVGCFGLPNSQVLDFISQRMNEYSEGLMDTQGAEGANSFVPNLLNSTDPEIFPPTTGSLVSYDFNDRAYSMFGAMSPFDVYSLTDDMKLSDRTLHFFAPPAQPELFPGDRSNLMVYDAPIENLFNLDEEGKQIRQLTTQTVSIGSPEEPEDQQQYVTEKAFLKPIVFRLSPTEQERDQGVTTVQIQAHLSLYAFMYFDYSEFYDEYNAGRGPVSQDSTGLSAGMGFINSSTLIGRKTFYRQQPAGTPPLGPLDPSSKFTNTGTKLQDVRTVTSNMAPPIDHSVFQSVSEALLNSDLTPSDMKFIPHKDYFSKFWISKDSKDSARFLFAFDKLAYLARNSLFPSLYQNGATANELLEGGTLVEQDQTARILHINAKKRGIYFEQYGGATNGLSIIRNKPTDDEYYQSEVIVPNISRVGRLSPIESGVEYFEGNDSYEKEFKAQDVVRYEYGVDIAIHDPSISYLQKLSTTLSAHEKNIREVYDMIINSPPIVESELLQSYGESNNGIGLYDSKSGRRLRELSSIVVSPGVTAQNIIDEGTAFAATYIGNIAFPSVGDFGSEDTTRILNNLRSLASSPNPYGIKEVADIILSFARYINKILETTLPENPLNLSNLARSDIFQGTNSHAILRCHKYFEEIFEYGRNYGNGYDYIFSEEDYPSLEAMRGIPRISRSAFTSRLTLEFSKYFGLTVPNLDPSQASPFGLSSGIFANAAYQFITPRLIKTYGAPVIDQTEFRNLETNEIDFPINRYARLFADLEKIKRSTKYLNCPYYYLENSEGNPSPESDGLRPLLQNLYNESCQVSTGVPDRNFVNLGISEDRGAITALNISPGLTDVQREDESGLDLLGALLGRLSLAEQQFERVINDEFERDSQSREDLEPAEAAEHPIKLLFGIFGSMVLTQGTDNRYREIAAITDELGLHQQNIIPSLESNQVSSPNQYKAMLVMGGAPNQVSVGAGGVQAVRVKLEDIDAAPPARSLNIIQPGDEFPPYTQTADPMRIFSKFTTFWMNYKQLGVIEYLDSFDAPVDDLSSLGVARWRKFNESNFVGTGEQNLLCRIRPIAQDDLDPSSNIRVTKKELFNLDLYNQYFILEAGN